MCFLSKHDSFFTKISNFYVIFLSLCLRADEGAEIVLE